MGRPAVVLVLLSLLALLIYSNTFSVPFLFDDSENIVGNAGIRNLANFLDLSGTRYVGFFSFALNYAVGGLNVFGYHLVNFLIHVANGFLVYSLVLLLFQGPERRSWKPEAGREKSSFKLQASSLHLDHRSPSPDPRVTGHWSLVTGHAPPWIALLTALLFIAHPIQTQAVTYIVQRFASLVTLFYLLAVVCYLKWRIGETRGWKLEAGSRKLEAGKSSIQHPASSFCGICGSWLWYVASLLSTLLAMKTKENSLTIPLTILLVEVIFFRAIRGAHVAPSSGKATWSLPLNGPSGLVRWLTLFPFLLTMLIVPLSYLEPLGEAAHLDTPDLTRLDVPDLSRLEYLFTQFRVIVTYLRLLVLPINQSLDYDYPVYRSFLAPPVLVSFLFLLGLFGLAVYLLRLASNSPQPPLKLRGGEGELFAFGILWFFLTLSVESSIIPIKDVIFEHRVYLPSVGFFLVAGILTASAWERWKRLRIPVILFVLVLVGGFSVAAHRRNEVWRDPMTLWEDVVRKTPNKERGHSNLGKVYHEKGRFDDALREYRTALRSNPGYPAGIYDNMGVVYGQQGRWEEALRQLQTALELNPHDAEIHNNRGIVYQNQGRIGEAIAEFQTALRLKPDHAPAHNNLAFAYKGEGRLDEAIDEYQATIGLSPDYAEAHNGLGAAYTGKGAFAEAIAEYRTALQLKPALFEAHYNLGLTWQAMGRLEEARTAFEQALKINPDFKAARKALDTFDSPP